MRWPSRGSSTPSATASRTRPVRVGDLLDLGRADPVAGGLDHLVVAADEVEEALLVGDDGVARPDRELGRRPPLIVAARSRPEPLGGALRVVPVARAPRARRGARARPPRPARNASRRAGRRGSRRSGSPCRSSRAGGRPRPDRGRSSGTPRSARTSGTAVRRGEDRAQPVERRARHPAAGVGEVAQCSPASSGQSWSAIWIHSGGTQVSPVTRCRAHSRTTSRGQQVVHEHHVRADGEAPSSAG